MFQNRFCASTFLVFRFGEDAQILHFLGQLKPWHHTYDSGRDQVYLHASAGPADRAALSFVQRWWQVHQKCVRAYEVR